MKIDLLSWLRRSFVWSIALSLGTGVVAFLNSRSLPVAFEYALLLGALGGPLATLDYRQDHSIKVKSKKGVSVWILSVVWGGVLMLLASISSSSTPIVWTQPVAAIGLSLVWSSVDLIPLRWLGRQKPGHAP